MSTTGGIIMRYMVSCITFSLLFVATTSSASRLQIVTGDNYAPYAAQYLPEGGLTTNVVKQVYKNLNEDVEIDLQSWSQGYSQTKTGQYAATFPYGSNPERDKEFIYSDSLFDMKLNTFSSPDSELDPTNISSYVGKTQCMPSDWTPSPKFQPLVQSEQIKLEPAKNIAACAQMVIEGKADFFNADPEQGEAAIKRIGADASQIIVSAEAVDVKSLYMIASKSDPKSIEIITKFNTGLRMLKARGEYDKIVSIYQAK
jgi:polar amino acid transport system substrate-binding protein